MICSLLCCVSGRGQAAHHTDRNPLRVGHKQRSGPQSKRPKPASTAFLCPELNSFGSLCANEFVHSPETEGLAQSCPAVLQLARVIEVRSRSPKNSAAPPRVLATLVVVLGSLALHCPSFRWISLELRSATVVLHRLASTRANSSADCSWSHLNPALTNHIDQRSSTSPGPHTRLELLCLLTSRSHKKCSPNLWLPREQLLFSRDLPVDLFQKCKHIQQLGSFHRQLSCRLRCLSQRRSRTTIGMGSASTPAPLSNLLLAVEASRAVSGAALSDCCLSSSYSPRVNLRIFSSCRAA